MKREKDNSLIEEREALEALNAVSATIGDNIFDADHLLKLVMKIGSAIDIHRNTSENYIHFLEEVIRNLRRRLD
ncbi:MAG: hypothetical protein WBQ25_07485 [Nitrososphaeraceae archaeon]